jgi:[ribosomal protein S5]-alanine N-acetyltransferase
LPLKPFRSHRFEFREVSLQDSEAFVARFEHPSIDDVLMWQQARPRLNFQLGVFSQATDELVATVGVLMEGCKGGQASLFLQLSLEYLGRYAYASEIGYAAIQWAFDALSLNALVASPPHQNQGITRLMKYAGFVKTQATSSAQHQNWILHFGAWQDKVAKLTTTQDSHE